MQRFPPACHPLPIQLFFATYGVAGQAGARPPCLRGERVPIDYENMSQYTTPFRCPECGEQTFQTDASLTSPAALVEAECTNCGHPLTAEEIDEQVSRIPPAAILAMIAKSRR